MNSDQAATLMHYLGSAYGNFDVTVDRIAAYHDALDDLDGNVVLSAARQHVRESQWPPSPAELRTRICGPARPQLTGDDYAVRNEARRLARGTINTFGVEKARVMIGEERWDELFPTPATQPVELPPAVADITARLARTLDAASKPEPRTETPRIARERERPARVGREPIPADEQRRHAAHAALDQTDPDCPVCDLELKTARGSS